MAQDVGTEELKESGVKIVPHPVMIREVPETMPDADGQPRVPVRSSHLPSLVCARVRMCVCARARGVRAICMCTAFILIGS